MRDVWDLLADECLTDSGKECMLNIVLGCTNVVHDRVIMLIWRIWQLRNDLVDDKEVPPIDVTVNFLVSYMRSLDHSQRYDTRKL